jgi:hypothetical protein
MVRVSRAIADYIVREAVSTQTSLSLGQIEPLSSIGELGLNSAAKQQVQEQIVRTVESIGFRTTLSIDAFSDARTVGDLVDLLLAAIDSGWLR